MPKIENGAMRSAAIADPSFPHGARWRSLALGYRRAAAIAIFPFVL